MGGTTAKVGLIQDGRPSVTKDYNVGGHAGAGIGGMSLSGYPVRTPVVDLVEIGAGGGSIAWVDSGGLLRVGPQSAGADPGPVCYRRGGVEPTVTDANVVLGRLDPSYFLGGEIGLDVERARPGDRGAVRQATRAERHRGGERHRRDRERREMVNALHLISVQRGYDPRDFVLVGFGGAGPVHANALARDAEMPTLLIPRSPGIFSATGLLTTDLKRDTATTVTRSVSAGLPQATSCSSTKPTLSPRRNRAGRSAASSRAASVTAPVRTWRSASVIAAALPSRCDPGRARSPRRAPPASSATGTTRTFLSDSSAARSAAMITFGEFGSTTTSSAGTSWMPASSS